MVSFDDDLRKMIRRNKLLGMWAAKQLGLVGADADAYSDTLAMYTIDPEHSDVFSKVRKDFDTAGVIRSSEQILRVMNELFLKVADPAQAARGNSPDGAAVMIARNLMSRRDSS